MTGDSHKCGVMQGGTRHWIHQDQCIEVGSLSRDSTSVLQLWEFDLLVDLNMDPKVVHSEQVITARVAFS